MFYENEKKVYDSLWEAKCLCVGALIVVGLLGIFMLRISYQAHYSKDFKNSKEVFFKLNELLYKSDELEEAIFNAKSIDDLYYEVLMYRTYVPVLKDEVTDLDVVKFIEECVIPNEVSSTTYGCILKMLIVKEFNPIRYRDNSFILDLYLSELNVSVLYKMLESNTLDLVIDCLGIFEEELFILYTALTVMATIACVFSVVCYIRDLHEFRRKHV